MCTQLPKCAHRVHGAPYIPLKTAFASATQRKWNQHKKYEMYMPNAKTQRQGPNATYIPREMEFALATQRKWNLHQKKEMYMADTRN